MQSKLLEWTTSTVQQSNCHHMIESISMASHVEGWFLAVISSAKSIASFPGSPLALPKNKNG